MIWTETLAQNDVLVFTMNKLYDLLSMGFLRIEEFDLLVFDECHHTDSNHAYNLIMQDFFYFQYQPGKSKRPRILGLTASPIKSKLKDNDQTNLNAEIRDKLQTLADNLHSKFVLISEETIRNLEQNQSETEI